MVSSCSRYYLTIEKERLSKDSLASSTIGSPDPRLANPPLGERLIIEWYIPKDLISKHPKVVLDVIYWNYTEQTIEFALDRNLGYKTLDLEGKDFEQKQGYLAYKAKLITDDGKCFRVWKHRMWVNLIDVRQEEIPAKKEDFEADIRSDSETDDDDFDKSW